jgi:hypothetical protein
MFLAFETVALSYKSRICSAEACLQNIYCMNLLALSIGRPHASTGVCTIKAKSEYAT